MIRYNVRSRYLVDVVSDIKSGKLILNPFFQRKLVWRDAHKIDFIQTILLRFPFPEVFIARGDLDVDTMTSTSCVVDGQQRLNAIVEFINGKFPVGGKHYSDLSSKEKEYFLKYEIAIIDLDLAQNDSQIVDIFTRLNRTFYALSAIEKQATEFASSEFMLVAKLLCGELRRPEDEADNIDPDTISTDPNLTKEFVTWANTQEINDFRELILDSKIFSKYEISRMVHLAFTLNLMATAIGGFYNRNEKVADYLEEYTDELPEKKKLVKKINSTAKLLNKTNLLKTDFWSAKSNVFTLFCALFGVQEKLKQSEIKPLSIGLNVFAKKPPADYALAAREAVNNRQERRLRDGYVSAVISKTVK